MRTSAFEDRNAFAVIKSICSGLICAILGTATRRLRSKAAPTNSISESDFSRTSAVFSYETVFGASYFARENEAERCSISRHVGYVRSLLGLLTLVIAKDEEPCL